MTDAEKPDFVKNNLSVRDIYAMAYRFYQGGKFEDAERFFRLLTTLETTNFHHWMGLAGALQMQKKYQAAIDAYGAAALLEITETNPFPHVHAAECLFMLQELTRAKQALQSAQRIAAKDHHFKQLQKQLNLLEERWFNHDYSPHASSSYSG